MKSELESKIIASEPINLREVRGAKLFVNGHVVCTENSFFVQSDTNPDIVYECQDDRCECPDFQKREQRCKHLWAVEYYFLANGVN